MANPSASVDVFNPSKRTWTSLPDLPGVATAVGALSDGIVVVVVVQGQMPSSQLVRWDNAAGRWERVAEFSGSGARSNAAIAGEFVMLTETSNFRLYSTRTGTLVHSGALPHAVPYGLPLTQALQALPEQRFAAVGESWVDVFDVRTMMWSSIALGEAVFATGTVIPVQGGRLMVLGESRPNPTNRVRIIDVGTGQAVDGAVRRYSRSLTTAIVLNDGRVLLLGGLTHGSRPSLSACEVSLPTPAPPPTTAPSSTPTLSADLVVGKDYGWLHAKFIASGRHPLRQGRIDTCQKLIDKETVCFFTDYYDQTIEFAYDGAETYYVTYDLDNDGYRFVSWTIVYGDLLYPLNFCPNQTPRGVQ